MLVDCLLYRCQTKDGFLLQSLQLMFMSFDLITKHILRFLFLAVGKKSNSIEIENGYLKVEKKQILKILTA